MKLIQKAIVLVLIFLFCIENSRAAISFISLADNFWISLVRDLVILFAACFVVFFIPQKKAYLFRWWLISALFALIFAGIYRLDELKVQNFFHPEIGYLRAFLIFAMFRSLISDSNEFKFATKALIVSGLITAALNIVVYYYFPHLITRNQGIRVSIGNASIHSSFLLVISIVSLFGTWPRSTYLKLMISISFLIAAVATATATCLVFLILMLFLFFIAILIKIASSAKVSKSIAVKFIFSLILLSGFFFVVRSIPDSLVESVINKSEQATEAIFQINLTGTGTLSIRSNQFNLVSPHLEGSNILLGLPKKLDGLPLFIENQYLAFLANYGIAGLGLFMFFLFAGICSTFFLRTLRARAGILLLWCLLGLFSWTLETLLCVQLIGIMAAAEATLVAQDKSYKSFQDKILKC